MSANQKRRSTWSLVLAVLLAVSMPSMVWALPPTSSAQQMGQEFSAAAEEAVPAVVSITVEKTTKVGSSGNQLAPFSFRNPDDPFGNDFFERFFRGQSQQQTPQEYHQMGQGSGFIISSDGYILTNNHVVGDVDSITVKMHDGREFTAKLIGADEKSDVALIKIPATNLPVLPLGDSSKLRVGEWVVAVGNPFGLSATVTVGVVSATGRSNVHIADYEDFIQTDAAINPGNSGGPLINLRGQAIGINTAIFSQSGGYMGIGFAIPIDMAVNIKDQLLKNGKVIRGQLGILVQELTPDLAESFNLKSTRGILVADVLEGSAAEKAGLKSGDIILEMNGREVSNVGEFRNTVAMLAPDTKVQLLVYRNGDRKTLTATIQELSDNAVASQSPEISEQIGLTVENLTEDTARASGVGMGKGVVVTSVTPYSSAQMAGIQPGDVILGINREDIGSVAEYNKAMEKASGKDHVLLLVKGNSYSRYITLPLKK